MADKAAEQELSAEEQENNKKIDALKEKYEAAMDDDLNTADAISVIFELVKLSNTTVSETSSKQYCQKLVTVIRQLCDILGIEVTREEQLLDTDIERVIEERQQARKNRDFARADEIRNQLLEQGIALEDTREGVKWKKI